MLHGRSGIHFPGWGKEGSDIWHPFAFSYVNEFADVDQNNVDQHKDGLISYDVWTKYQDEVKFNDIRCYRTRWIIELNLTVYQQYMPNKLIVGSW